MERGIIPPNIHYNTPRAGATALEENRIIVITEKLPIKEKNVLVGKITRKKCTLKKFVNYSFKV